MCNSLPRYSIHMVALKSNTANIISPKMAPSKKPTMPTAKVATPIGTLHFLCSMAIAAMSPARPGRRIFNNADANPICIVRCIGGRGVENPNHNRYSWMLREIPLMIKAPKSHCHFKSVSSVHKSCSFASLRNT